MYGWSGLQATLNDPYGEFQWKGTEMWAGAALGVYVLAAEEP